MPNPYDEDREILRRFQAEQLPLEGADPNYHYIYEYRGANGIHIHQAKTLGYEPVRGTMAENPMLRDESGYCTVGDCLLMRIPKDRYEQLERVGEARRRRNLGETEQDIWREEVDRKLSNLTGHNINVAFQFKDQRELSGRR